MLLARAFRQDCAQVSDWNPNQHPTRLCVAMSFVERFALDLIMSGDSPLTICVSGRVEIV